MKVTDKSYQATGHTCFFCDFSPPRAGDIALADQADIDADFISVAYNPGRAVRLEVKRDVDVVCVHDIHDDRRHAVFEAVDSPPAQVDDPDARLGHPPRVLLDDRRRA